MLVLHVFSYSRAAEVTLCADAIETKHSEMVFLMPSVGALRRQSSSCSRRLRRPICLHWRPTSSGAHGHSSRLRIPQSTSTT